MTSARSRRLLGLRVVGPAKPREPWRGWRRPRPDPDDRSLSSSFRRPRRPLCSGDRVRSPRSLRAEKPDPIRPKKNSNPPAPRQIGWQIRRGPDPFSTRRWIVSRSSWLKAFALAAALAGVRRRRDGARPRTGPTTCTGPTSRPKSPATGSEYNVALRQVLRLSPRAADRAPDPGPVLPQLLRRQAHPRASAIRTAGTTGTRRSSTRATTSSSTSSDRRPVDAHRCRDRGPRPNGSPDDVSRLRPLLG